MDGIYLHSLGKEPKPTTPKNKKALSKHRDTEDGVNLEGKMISKGLGGQPQANTTPKKNAPIVSPLFCAV